MLHQNGFPQCLIQNFSIIIQSSRLVPSLQVGESPPLAGSAWTVLSQFSVYFFVDMEIGRVMVGSDLLGSLPP